MERVQFQQEQVRAHLMRPDEPAHAPGRCSLSSRTSFKKVYSLKCVFFSCRRPRWDYVVIDR